MKHYGPEAPWEGEGKLGYWRWFAPRADDWFEEPGYWQWYPPRSLTEQMGEIMKNYYIKPLQDALSQPSVLLTRLA